MLSLIIFIPLIAMIAILFLPKEKEKLLKLITISTTGLQLLLSLYVWCSFDAAKSIGVHSAEAFAFVERVPWISVAMQGFGELSAHYYIGLDGLNISMLLLSGIVMFIGAIASWNITKKIKGYTLLYLLLSTAVYGCFVSLDLLLFYLFFEFMLLPLYFLIGIWGGKRREYASIKFFLYTLFGSIFILLVIIGLYLSVADPVLTAINVGLIDSASQLTPAVLEQIQFLIQTGEVPAEAVVHTFDMVIMTDASNYLKDGLFSPLVDSQILGYSARTIAFIALLIGFGIKLPLVPFHTWLPDAHVQAPTAVSVVFAGILLKLGGYGLMRMGYAIFPSEGAELAWYIALLGIISIIWGAYNALAQKDLKRLVAYSSVSHMGFVLLGLASYTVEGTTGAIYQMFSHGILSALLFIIVGVIYDRVADRNVDSFKGLAVQMPHYTAITTVAFFASLGLPAFSTFVAEILVFVGAFSSQGANGLIPHWMVLIALLSVVLTAGYFLWTLQRVFFGKLWLKDDSWKEKLKDLTIREYVMMVPLAVLSFVFGILPMLLTNHISPSINVFVEMMNNAIK